MCANGDADQRAYRSSTQRGSSTRRRHFVAAEACPTPCGQCSGAALTSSATKCAGALRRESERRGGPHIQGVLELDAFFLLRLACLDEDALDREEDLRLKVLHEEDLGCHACAASGEHSKTDVRTKAGIWGLRATMRRFERSGQSQRSTGRIL